MVEAPTDAELVTAARSGDADAFGQLVARYRSSMLAVAWSVLGWRAEAEDAVQEATLIGLRRLGELRNPEAVGPWLRSITRNASRMELRSARPTEPLDAGTAGAAPGPTPEEVLDEHALHDWIWTAINELSEPLQAAVLLRYFSAANSYAQIAAACGVPIGTVRSRLSQTRRLLGERLAVTKFLAHGDAVGMVAERRSMARYLLGSAQEGRFRETLTEITVPDMVLSSGGRHAVGRTILADMMESDLSAGVRQRLGRVTASRQLTILECDLLSPPEDPEHCPPAVLWLMTMSGNRISRVRLFHPAA